MAFIISDRIDGDMRMAVEALRTMGGRLKGAGEAKGAEVAGLTDDDEDDED